ncbi:MAG: hypothetical protein J2P36_25695 [Ktedonobacteraceae bacterium]|nr:hypothetical protein [Ktedonobacteraceae bacterium]
MMKKVLYRGRWESAKVVNHVRNNNYCARHRAWHSNKITCPRCAEIAHGAEIKWLESGAQGCQEQRATVVELLPGYEDVKIFWRGQEMMLPQNAYDVRIKGLDY